MQATCIPSFIAGVVASVLRMASVVSTRLAVGCNVVAEKVIRARRPYSYASIKVTERVNCYMWSGHTHMMGGGACVPGF